MFYCLCGASGLTGFFKVEHSGLTAIAGVFPRTGAGLPSELKEFGER